MGGLWAIVEAPSETAILDVYPELVIVHKSFYAERLQMLRAAVGPCAKACREPSQGRKAAALSGLRLVPQPA